MHADAAPGATPDASRGASHLRSSARTLAQRLRRCLLGAGLPTEVTQDLDAPAGDTVVPDAWTMLAQLDAVIDPHPASALSCEQDWQAVLRRLWRHEPWRQALDCDPGLRTALRHASGRSTAGLVSDVLASRLECRQEPALITLAEGRLWIADDRWDELSYHWELPMDPAVRRGDHPGCVQASQASRLMQLRTAFAHGLDSQPQRGFLHHARYLGGIPASGFAIPQPGHDGAELVATLRQRRDPGPCVVLTTPQLLPWSGEAWPSSHQAVVSALLAEVIARVPHGTLVAGSWSIDLAAPTPLPALRLMRTHDRLLVEANGLVALITAHGWFPRRYLAQARRESWSFATLEACGWSDLQRHGCWQLLRVGAGEPWIAVPARELPSAVPEVEQLPAPWSGAGPGPLQLALAVPLPQL